MSQENDKKSIKENTPRYDKLSDESLSKISGGDAASQGCKDYSATKGRLGYKSCSRCIHYDYSYYMTNSKCKAGHSNLW